MKNADTPHSPPIIAALKDFDYDSGSLLERLLFNHRPIILVLCAITTICLGFAATKVQLSGDYLQSIPAQQPYIVNYLNHFDDLSTQSNAVQIVVAANHGTILNAHFLELLRQINDKVYLLPGVNRPFMKSLWTANTQWQQVTAQGLVGGRLIDQDYDGSPKAVKEVALHIQDGAVAAEDRQHAIGLWAAGTQLRRDCRRIQLTRRDVAYDRIRLGAWRHDQPYL
jgi:predicted RND superfamily exporter protein